MWPKFENVWKAFLTSTIGAGLMGLAIYGWYFDKEPLTNNEALVLFGAGFALLWIRGAIETALRKLIIELPTRLLTKWFGGNNTPPPTAVILLLMLVGAAAYSQNQPPINTKEIRIVHKNDSVGISGIGMIRYDEPNAKFRFWDGSSWFTYSKGTSAEWGNITGTLSDQTDLQTALDGKVGLTGTQTITGTKTFDAAIISTAGSDEVLYRRSSDGFIDGNSQFTYGGGGNPVQVPSIRIANLVSGMVPYTVVNDEIDGEANFAYNPTTNTLTVDNLSVSTGVSDGGGLKHKRVTTGSVAAGNTAEITVTWDTPFADTNYTVTASVVVANPGNAVPFLEIVHIDDIAAGSLNVRVVNGSAGALTGTVQVIAIHD